MCAVIKRGAYAVEMTLAGDVEGTVKGVGCGGCAHGSGVGTQGYTRVHKGTQGYEGV